ncbi:MAG: HupE/UreJ family protein [Pseudomonadota bacterium]
MIINNAKHPITGAQTLQRQGTCITRLMKDKYEMLFKRNLFFLIAWVLLLTLLSKLAYAHGMSEAEKQSIIEGGNLRYMWLGATHMLSGYDHLAFVFGIIFFLTTFRDIAKYVTAFTLGHSVTLIFATFNAIQLNYFAIDAVIALSVCYIAFANIDGFRKYLNVNPPNMMLMIIGLGLIHGFGLSTRLQELPLSEDSLLLNIISFNVGIELGQISALALMLLLVATWRKSHFFQTFSMITNYGLIIAGGLLFLMQMHGYEHTINPEEFAVSATPTQGAEKRAIVTDTVKAQDSQQIQWKDSITVTIPARGNKEYKLHLAEGATFEYAWQTDGESLFFDFHGEPTGDTTGFFQSFNKSTERQSSGALTASFDGTHGWYWKNSTRSPVTITLKVKGDYQRLDSKMMSQDTIPVQKADTRTHDTID